MWSWVYILKHSLFRLKITVGCLTSTYPSIHVEDTFKITVGCLWSTYPSIHFSLDEDTLEITVGCLVYGVLCFVCVHVVLCVVLVVCVLLCCGGAHVWCVVRFGTLSLSLALFSSLFRFFLLSLFFSLLFLFLFLLLLLLLLLLLFLFFFSLSSSRHQSTNTAANIEAFECDLAKGKCTAVGSIPPPFSSSPPQK